MEQQLFGFNPLLLPYQFWLLNFLSRSCELLDVFERRSRKGGNSLYQLLWRQLSQHRFTMACSFGVVKAWWGRRGTMANVYENGKTQLVPGYTGPRQSPLEQGVLWELSLAATWLTIKLNFKGICRLEQEENEIPHGDVTCRDHEKTACDIPVDKSNSAILQFACQPLQTV